MPYAATVHGFVIFNPHCEKWPLIRPPRAGPGEWAILIHRSFPTMFQGLDYKFRFKANS